METKGEHLGIKWEYKIYGDRFEFTSIFVDFIDADICDKYKLSLQDPYKRYYASPTDLRHSVNEIIEQIVQRQYEPGGTKYQESKEKVTNLANPL